MKHHINGMDNLEPGEAVILAAYALTCEACAKYGQEHGECMSQDEWWATMREKHDMLINVSFECRQHGIYLFH